MRDEWHHTSRFGNKTSYWSAETVAEKIHLLKEGDEQKRKNEETQRLREEFLESWNSPTPPKEFKASNGLTLDTSNFKLYKDGERFYADEWSTDEERKLAVEAMNEYSDKYGRNLEEREYKKWLEERSAAGEKPSDKSEGTGAKGFREASTEELRSFDNENGTEFEKFAESINNGNSSLVSQKFFHIGNTGELLNSFGLKGNITIGRKALNSGRHSNSKGHNLGSGNWLDVIKSINNPIAITRYKDRNNSYRVYTNVEFDGGKICVGVDVNVVGKNIEVTNIHTAFTRELKDMLRSSNERLIYPSEEKIKQHIGQSSSKHNAEIYDQHTASDGKGTTSSATDQTNDAKLSLPRDEEYAKAVESGDEKKSLPREEEMFEQPVKRDDENMGEFAQRMRDYDQAEAERAKVNAFEEFWRSSSFQLVMTDGATQFYLVYP